MRPESVETIIARCLIEPGSLGAGRIKPESREEIDVLFGKADAEKIRRFAGFICKVQHNYLWDSFPATRRLIRHNGIELDVFIRYRLQHTTRLLKSESVDARTLRFINFLDEYFSRCADSPVYPALREVFRHERLIWETRREGIAANASTMLTTAHAKDLQWSRFKRLVIGLNPPLRVHPFNYDVQLIVSEVADGNFVDEFHCGPERFLGYRLDRSNDSVRVIELDRITAHLLSLINGSRSVRAVISAARASGLSEARPIAFRSFFEEASRSGFINFLAEGN
jgi:hypothetical protein